MTDETLLSKLFSSIANQMLIDAKATGLAQHRGSKGTVRESQFIRNFLSKYLPRAVIAEHSGEIVATNGVVSRQCDVLIIDPETPPLWSEEHYRIVPIESVHGAIEVKSFVDAEELRKTWRNMRDIKSMPKTAYYPAPLEKRRGDGGEWSPSPAATLLFAYDGVSLETLGGVLAELEAESPGEPTMDSVWVLSKGYLNWRSSWDGEFSPPPIEEIKTQLTAISSEPAQLLMALTFHLYSHFAHAWTPRLYIAEYFPSGPWGGTASAAWEGTNRVR
jgi:hypothetical protein